MTVSVKLSDIFDLAKKIEDVKLRKMTIDFLKNPVMTYKDLGKKYPPADLAVVPASIQFHHTYDKGLVEHTYVVTKLAIDVAETFNKKYGVGLDMDALISGALLHDIGKLWGLKKGSSGWEPSGLMLDHTMAGTSELYARGFPEKVIHIVASHFGENGPTPPQTMEALIFHTVDNLDATINANRQENLINLILKQQQ